MSLLTSLFGLTPPQLPTGYCPQSYQDLVNTIINGTQVTFLIDTGNFLFNFGNATPAPENRIFPWLVFDPSSPYNGMWFTFQAGMWVAPVSVRDLVPGFRQMYLPPAGTLESAVWSLDSGDGTDPTITPPTQTTGAMWQVDHTVDGRFPVASGVVPGSDLGTGAASIGIAQTGDSQGRSGEYAHQLTDVEGAVGQHTHPFGINDPTSDDGFFASIPTAQPTANPYNAHFITGSGHGLSLAETTYNFQTLPAGNGAGVTAIKHNTMPPYVGVWWLMHTARKFYTLPA